MNAERRPRSLLARMTDRLGSVGALALVLGLVGGAPSTALGAGSSRAPGGSLTTQAPLDPAGLLEALQRGELPGEVVVIGTGIAIAAGLLLTLFVAALRSRRRRRSMNAPLEPVPEASFDPIASRSTVPWPRSDTRLEAPPDLEDQPSIRAPMSTGWPAADATMAADAEADAAREAALEDWPEEPAATIQPHAIDGPSEREAQGPAGAGAGGDRTAEATGASEHMPGPSESRLATRSAESLPSPALQGSVPAGLGTPQAPLVVELRGERGSASGPNVSVVVAIAVVTIGVAFAGGALIGAGLGTTLGVTIGLAFAGGAGTAIGVTAMLLRGRR